MPARRGWSLPLPQPITIPSVMKLRTLGDVRTLLGHLPKEHRAKDTWRHVAKTLSEAARGACDPADVSVALRLVLSMEGIAYRQC
jgi:hypothetical protein